MRACEETGRDPATLGYSVMTACFLGDDRREVVARIGECSASTRRPTQKRFSNAARAPGSRGRWRRSPRASTGCEDAGVTRVFLEHLNHADDEMVALIGDRLSPVVT